jgi:hypothetical protein
MMAELQIPPSVLAYMTREPVRAATDQLLGHSGKSTAMGVDTWADVKNYHRALLSAQQIKAEFAVFLIDLWEEVWADLVEHRSEIKSALTPAEQIKTWNYAPPSPRYLWDEEGSFFRAFAFPDMPTRIIEFAVDLRPAVGLQLRTAVWDDHDPVTNDVELPDPWAPGVIDDGRQRGTKSGFWIGRPPRPGAA